ncbi:MAG: GTP-binding protein, partial [Nitrososphaeraceae archaeon]|nr:GTP-binding protein [Nitrososphaeraceae archaeon]
TLVDPRPKGVRTLDGDPPPLGGANALGVNAPRFNDPLPRVFMVNFLSLLVVSSMVYFHYKIIFYNNKMSYDFLIKGLIVGNIGIGKTAFVTAYIDGTFEHCIPPTIGIDFKSKIIVLDNKPIKIQLYDSSGMDRFQTITNSYYRQADFIILMYDLTDRNTFIGLKDRLFKIKHYVPSDVPILLIGTKLDLTMNRNVDIEEIEAFASSYNLDSIEISSRKPEKISGALDSVITKVMDNMYKTNNLFPNIVFEEQPKQCCW